MAVAYISFGSNIGNRMEYIETALGIIRANSYVQQIQVSSYYETEPVGNIDQPKFINGVAKIATVFPCKDLLSFLQGIEGRLGRERTVKWGPRTIDLDILLYDDVCISQPDMQVPHPEMHKRAFVLIPLCEIAPEVRHPVLKKTIRELVENIPNETKWSAVIQ